MVVQAQDMKVETVIAPATVTLATNSSTYGYLDTLGWDHAKMILVSATEATTSACAVVLQITEGTNSTAASAIVALTGGTATSTSVGFVIPDYSAEGAAVCFDIDLRKRERYLRVHVGPGTASTFGVIALLSRGRAMPGSDDGSVASGAHVIA